MKANAYLKEELVSELRNVSKRMLEETDLDRKLFLYSAAHGITSRTLRYDFNKETLLVDAILNITYNTVLGRLNSLKAGERVVPLTGSTIDSLAKCVGDIAEAIDKEESCYEVLQRLMVAAYVTTGPGYYQSMTGEIGKVD